MQRSSKFFVFAAALVFAVAASAPVSVSAFAYQYNLGNLFSGDKPAITNGPYVNALFEDVTPGTVRLTISALNLSNNEHIGELDFNLDPALNATNLTFNNSANVGLFDLPSISLGTDGFKADGDGKYDIQFLFNTSSSGGANLNNWFSNGDKVTYLISGIASLEAVDFVFLSQPVGGGAGPYYAATHVVSITQGGNGDTSGWFSPSDTPYTPVPEPGSITLLAAGLIFWMLFLRRNFTQPRLARIPARCPRRVIVRSRR